MKNINLLDRPRRCEQILEQAAAGTVVLLCLEGGQYYALDEIGGRVWSLCDGGLSVAGIAARIADEYEAPVETIQQDVLALLTDLAHENLVVANPAPVGHS